MDALLDFFHKVYDVKGVIAWGGLLGMTGIVFAETGLLVGFFLPGDSLLVAAGLLIAKGDFQVSLWALNASLIAAAILGDTVGYWFGFKTGQALFRKEDSFLFRRKHLLAAQAFYERHGGKTIVLARFMPIIRTFAPVVAGVARMDYRRFLFFNVFGGTFWVLSMIFTGYYLGLLFPNALKRIDMIILVVIFVSLLPGLIGVARARFSKG